MLPRSSRLHDGRDIGEVSRRGRRARSGDLSVTARTGGTTSAVRAAVVVGKRSGGAVVRNRQRRRLRHALLEVLPALPAGTDLVVRSGPGIDLLAPAALRADLRRAALRAAGVRETGR